MISLDAAVDAELTQCLFCFKPVMLTLLHRCKSKLKCVSLIRVNHTSTWSYCFNVCVQVSQYEAQVARLRAQVERGEAQRQTLEYDVAVARRDVAVEKRKSEEKMRDLREHNLKLEGVCV